MRKSGIKISGMHQVCIVVRDLEYSIKKFEEEFGIGPWEIVTFKPDYFETMTYHGRPDRFGFRIARNQQSGLEIELAQHLEGNTIYRDFLEQNGEGVHHIGWLKVSTEAEFEEQKQSLEDLGHPCLMEARSQRGRFAYFDTTSTLHTILEIVWRKHQM